METTSALAKSSGLTWQDVLKGLGIAIVVIAAWSRLESRIDDLNARTRRIEQVLNSYMPREVQAAHDQLVLEKLDSLKDEVGLIGRQIDKQPH